MTIAPDQQSEILRFDNTLGVAYTIYVICYLFWNNKHKGLTEINLGSG